MIVLQLGIRSTLNQSVAGILILSSLHAKNIISEPRQVTSE